MRIPRYYPLIVMLLLFSPATRPAHASHYLPLRGLAPETAVAGTIDARLGASYSEGEYLLFDNTDRDRRLARTPEATFAIGLSDNVELVVAYDCLLLSQNGESFNFGSGDIRVATVVALASETDVLPAFAVILLTKLPNADDDRGFGTDQTDFHVGVSIAKGFGDSTLLANLKMGIMDHPSYDSTQQDDVLSFSLGLHHYITDITAIGGEISGITNSRFGNERGNLDFGLALNIDPVVLDITAGVGLNEDSGEWRAGFGMSFPLLEFDPVTYTTE